MDIQEAHLAVLTHFSRPSSNLSFRKLLIGDQYCVYRKSGRSDDQTRCAVGVLIPDELYESEWDSEKSMFIADLIDISPELSDLFKRIPLSYLEDLQAAHDLSTSVEEFLEKLEFIAEEHNISLIPDFPPAVEEEAPVLV